jgi:hypothetical protein
MRMQKTAPLSEYTEEAFYRRYADRIWPEPNSGCWLWAGCTSNGYAEAAQHMGTKRVHKILYLLRHGPIPEGLHLDHLCRVRCCVNPDHLEPVTPQENVRRGDSGIHNRLKTHCPRGHPLSGDNLYIGRNGRNCLACRREAFARKGADRRKALAEMSLESFVGELNALANYSNGKGIPVCAEAARRLLSMQDTIRALSPSTQGDSDA